MTFALTEGVLGPVSLKNIIFRENTKCILYRGTPDREDREVIVPNTHVYGFRNANTGFTFLYKAKQQPLGDVMD